MEREIKLRAWDEINKIMHYNFQFVKSGDEGNDWIIFISDKQPIDYSWDKNPYFSQQLKITQFTGLLDKNGKEIYEGDILNIEDCELIIVNNHSPNGPDEKMIDSIVTVFYEGCSFCFTHPNSNTSCPIDYDEMGKIEVIGNLYENPELL